jgi:Flp pilus assembly protein TadG
MRERGSTLIEFTLTLLPLLALLMLTFDTAWVLFASACLHEGVREGVRFAITGQSDTNIRAKVQQYSFGFITDSSTNGPVQVNYYSPSDPSTPIYGVGSNCAGNIVKVVVSGVSVSPVVPIWRSASPLILSTSSADVVEPNPICPSR